MIGSRLASKLLLVSSVVALTFASTLSTHCATTKLPPTFTYNPPDGTLYEIREKSSTLITSDQGQKQSRSQEGTTRVQVKKTPEGFDVAIFPITKSSLIDGRPPVEGTAQYLADYLDKHLKYTLKVDSKGNATDITGDHELVTYAANDLHLDTAAQDLFKELAKEYVNQLKSQWNEDISNFTGRSTKKGTTWVVNDSSLKENGLNVPHRIRYTVGDSVVISGKTCVKLGYTVSADPAALRDFVASSEHKIWLDDGNSFTIMSASIPFAKMKASGELIVDPATLLTYKDTVSAKILSQAKASSTLEVNITITLAGESKYTYIK